MKTLTKSVLIFAKFCRIFAKNVRESVNLMKMRQKTYKTLRSADKLDVLQSVTALEQKRLSFSENFHESFVLSPRFFCKNEKLNFAKTFAKKKIETIVLTIMKFVAKPHHFHAAPTPSQYFY
jgi:hypothetical protein